MPDLLEETEAYSAAAAPGTRRCSRCGALTPIEEFPIKSKSTGLRRVWCRPCCRAYGKEHYRRNKPIYVAKARARRGAELPRIRAWIDSYLRDHPCVDCGCAELAVLEFDHRERSEKVLTVGELARLGTWSKLRAEIEKCDVRCANCHRRRTADQLNWTKLRGIAIDPTEARPGTTHRYFRVLVPYQDALFSGEAHGLRRCSRCRELKPLAKFPFRDVSTGRRGYYCRPCQAAYRRRHYEANKPDYIARAMNEARLKREDALLLVHEYLRAHPCVDCGGTDIVTLEFDHIEATTKVMAVGEMLGRRNWSAIQAEIKKCEVRCANCHRRKTARQQGWKNRIAERHGRYGRMRRTRE